MYDCSHKEVGKRDSTLCKESHRSFQLYPGLFLGIWIWGEVEPNVRGGVYMRNAQIYIKKHLK